MTIFQPRTYEGNPVKLWSVTLGQLNEFCVDIQRKAERIEAGMALGSHHLRMCSSVMPKVCMQRVKNMLLTTS